MKPHELEQLFFKRLATSVSERDSRKRQSSDKFRQPPTPTGKSPYDLDLASVMPHRTNEIQKAGQLVIHMMGDSGGVNGTGAQQSVADHMTTQVHEIGFPDQPSFLFHLGDIVYYDGANSSYHDQFYQIYEDYPAPIFAIPGNHDGETEEPSETLQPFMRHFCSPVAFHAEEAGHSTRPTMIQPNCYWRLNTPVATFIGLYSNVSGELDNTDAGVTTQRDWLTQALRTAPADRGLLLTVHHPLFSLGKHGGTERVRDAIEIAINDSGRVPDAIFTGHDHNYQRFAWKREGRHIPVLVVGAGGFAGYDDLTPIMHSIELPDGVKLENYDDKHPGFLKLKITRSKITGEYFTVRGPGDESKPAKQRDTFELDLVTHQIS